MWSLYSYYLRFRFVTYGGNNTSKDVFIHDRKRIPEDPYNNWVYTNTYSNIFLLYFGDIFSVILIVITHDPSKMVDFTCLFLLFQ